MKKETNYVFRKAKNPTVATEHTTTTIAAAQPNDKPIAKFSRLITYTIQFVLQFQLISISINFSNAI